MSEVATRADVERLCWMLSGWRVEQRDVDRLLEAVDAYASGAVLPQSAQEADGGTESASEASEPVPVTVEPSTALNVPQTAVQDAGGIEGAYVLTVTRVQRPEPGKRPLPTPRADLTEPERTCRKCGVTYPIENFNRDCHSRGGRKTACKPCENTRRRDARRTERAADRAARAARGES